MKQIEIVPIWDNGKNQSAEILDTYVVNLRLGVSATFYYSLMSESKQTLATGNLTMSENDYEKWSDSDDYAWEFVATKLNLVIVGDWVDPIELTTDMEVGMGITDPSAKLEVTSPIEKESLTVETDTEI